MPTLREIIDFSKANPNTEYARQAYEHIKSGAFDNQAQTEGIDLSFAGRPPLQRPEAPAPKLGELVAEQYTGATEKFGESVTRGAEKIGREFQFRPEESPIGAAVKRPLRIAGAVGETALGAAAAGVQALFAPLTGLIQKGAQATGLEINQEHALIQRINQWAEANPDAARNLTDAITVGGALLGSKGLQAKAPPLRATAGALGQDVAAGAGAVKNFMQRNKLTDLEATGKILQGRTEDIQAGVKTLREVNVEGVKTYEELDAALDDRIKNLSKVVDERLAPDTNPRLLTELATETEVGGKAVQFNYVRKALDDLKMMYNKITDPVNEERIGQLIVKGEEGGFTAQEVNTIAREYNVEFGGKAFDARTGRPLTSVNAQSYENTRRGVKEVARMQMPDAGTKAIDAKITDTYDTKRLVEKMVENVNKLEQKVNKRTLIERIGRGVASGVDLATFGGLRGFIARLFPSNLGLKTLNSLDLQKQLTKNLKIIQKVLNASDEKAADILIQRSKSASRLATESGVSDDILKEMEGFFGELGGTPVDDLVDRVVSGKIEVRIPESMRTDAIETLGQGNYARIFRKKTTRPTASTLDELATDVGISDTELLELIAKKLRRKGQ